MSIGMETVRARRLHSRTVSPIQLRPTRSMSCRTSNGMSPSSTPIIQIPPSNPPRPSPPESQSSHGPRMWKTTMILLTKQFQPDTADLLLLRKADCAGFSFRVVRMTKNGKRLVVLHPTFRYLVLAFFSPYNNSTSDKTLVSQSRFLSRRPYPTWPIV